MAYTLGNKCAKNCCKRTILVQLIIENVVTCFFLEHGVDRHEASWSLYATAELVVWKFAKWVKADL